MLAVTWSMLAVMESVRSSCCWLRCTAACALTSSSPERACHSASARLAAPASRDSRIRT